MKTIGVLYICTGRYVFFWESFYRSTEHYFFQGDSYNREYFVFTDAPSVYGEENVHVHRISQENLGWPNNTLKRFEMFLRIRKQLENETDYLFFFNANMEFIAPVGEEILPAIGGNGLVGALHSWLEGQYKWNLPYERRRSSSAYIPYWKGKYYFQGSMFGGATMLFLRMCETCSQWVDKDISNNIKPIWQDESSINKYFIAYPPKILDCRYNYCEIKNLPVERKIVYRDKMKYFSFDELGRSTYKECAISKPFWERQLIRGLNFMARFRKR